MTAAENKKLTYVLKVTLDGISPPIWRRLLVSGDTDLLHLHMIIQVAMPWENYHLFSFTVNGVEYTIPTSGGFGAPPSRDAGKVTLREIAPKAGQQFLYTYDFGDTWNHKVLVEEIRPTLSKDALPSCVAGKRNAPPEDCGGPFGYGDMVATLQNPRARGRRELLEWLGRPFDPEAFDINTVNDDLKSVIKMPSSEISAASEGHGLLPLPDLSALAALLEPSPFFGDILDPLAESAVIEEFLSPRRAQITIEIIRLVANFVAEHNLGYVLDPTAGARYGQKIISGICFISKERLPALPDLGWLPVLPDLVIEVDYPDMKTVHEDTENQVKLYRKAKVTTWVIIPHKQQIEVHIPGQRRQVLSINDTLTGGDILPGFAVPVAQVLRT